MPKPNVEIGRDIEDALGWLSNQERDLTEVQQLIATVRNGGRVPLDIFDNAIHAIAAQQNAAAEQLRRVRGKLK